MNRAVVPASIIGADAGGNGGVSWSVSSLALAGGNDEEMAVAAGGGSAADTTLPDAVLSPFSSFSDSANRFVRLP